MATRKRTNQVSSILQRELVNVLRRSIADPRLVSLTISEVVVSPDMRHAKVYYTYLDDSLSQKEVAEAVNQAIPYFRSLLAKNTALRFMPKLHFHYDNSIAHGAFMNALLSDEAVLVHDDDA